MSASAILKLRQRKYYTCFAQAELENVLGHEKLSQSAKLLWVALNNQTKGNADLKITHTLAQMGKLIARKVRCVQGLVNELKEFGYLKLVQSKNAEGVLTHQIDLPQSALNDVSQSLNRGEAANTPTQFFAPTPAETCVPPTQKSASLYNKYNNKNNHMSVTHLCEEPNPQAQEQKQISEATKAIEEGKVHFERSEHLWNVEFADIESPRERIKRVNAEFTEQEQTLIQQYSEYLAATEQTTEQSQLIKAPIPSAILQNETSVPVQLNGEAFYVEPEVKNRAMAQIPRLIASGDIKGRPPRSLSRSFCKKCFFT